MPTPTFALRPYNGKLRWAASDQDTGGGEVVPEVPELAFEQKLAVWARTDAAEKIAIIYDTTVTDVIKTCDLLWPDGSIGKWTTLTINAPAHQWDKVQMTHAVSGKTVTLQVKARNADGLATGFTTSVS